jgi:hypothetical protein
MFTPCYTIKRKSIISLQNILNGTHFNACKENAMSSRNIFLRPCDNFCSCSVIILLLIQTLYLYFTVTFALTDEWHFKFCFVCKWVELISLTNLKTIGDTKTDKQRQTDRQTESKVIFNPLLIFSNTFPTMHIVLKLRTHHIKCSESLEYFLSSNVVELYVY